MKNLIVCSICSLLAALFATSAAAFGCTTFAKGMQLSASGVLWVQGVIPAQGAGYVPNAAAPIFLCSVATQMNGVPVATCKAWKDVLSLAIVTGKAVELFYDDTNGTFINTAATDLVPKNCTELKG